jgi:hypothetical protein
MFSRCLKFALLAVSPLCFVFSAQAASDSDAGKDTFEGNAFYAISTDVGGQKQVLTFIAPPNARADALTTSAGNAKVVLEAPKPKAKNQLWQFDHRPVSPGNIFTIYSKLSDSESRLTGVLQVFECNGDFASMDDEKFHDRYNRLTVGLHSGEQREYWQIIKQSNGKYKITSNYGMKEHLKTKDDSPNYGWREERVLEAVKTADGKIKIKHVKPSNAPGQLWTITKST